MNAQALGWCSRCGGVRPVQGVVLVPMRETKPHYQFRFEWLAACPNRHALEALCVGCEKAPAREGFDHCAMCWPEGRDEPVRDFKRDQVEEVKPLLRSGT